MQPLYTRQTILELIPQRQPIVEIDEFYGMDGTCARCGLTVRDDNLLINEGRLSEAGLLEHMAQSAAARTGYMAICRGEKVRLGFIGSVNNASFMRLPRVGEHLTTTVEVLETVMSIALVAISSRVADELVAECRMKIVTEQEEV